MNTTPHGSIPPKRMVDFNATFAGITAGFREADPGSAWLGEKLRNQWISIRT
jgi:hypothetical protein